MSSATPLEQCFIPEPNSGCWIWLLALNENGYGRRWHDGREQKAHRVLYENLVAVIPRGLELDHLCNVRCCVNPDHMTLVTHKQNTARSGFRKRKGVCKRGHLMVDGNLYLTKEGYRRCRQCVIDRARFNCQGEQYNKRRRIAYRNTMTGLRS